MVLSIFQKNPFESYVFGICIRKNELKGMRYVDLAVEPIPFKVEKFTIVNILSDETSPLYLMIDKLGIKCTVSLLDSRLFANQDEERI